MSFRNAACDGALSVFNAFQKSKWSVSSYNEPSPQHQLPAIVAWSCRAASAFVNGRLWMNSPV